MIDINMKNEKEYTEGISIKENKFLTWFDNFWYHYKWHTIVAIFLIVVLSICIFQMCSKKESDIIITYAGPKDFFSNSQEQININNSLSNEAKEQLGENASVNLNSYLIYSKEQIQDIEKETDENGKQKYKVNTSQITKNQSELETFSQLGESYIFFLDPYVYDHLKSQRDTRFEKLTDVFGKTPLGAYDEYAVRLVDTDFYKNNPSLHALPSDTLVCLHSMLVMSTSKKEYSKHVEYFKKIATVSSIDQNTESTKE